MLDLDITLLLQMINFFIALYVLNILLISPLRAILRERKAKMDGLSGEAAAFEREAAERLSAYEAELTRARQEAGLMRERARAEGLTEQRETTQKAARSAQAILAEAQTRIRAEADAALAHLRTQTHMLADKLAANVTK